MSDAHHEHDHGDEAPHQHPYDLPYHWTGSSFHRYVVEKMIERLATPLAGRRVLEAGCGDGFTTAQLARYAHAVRGFDLNERAIAFARLIVLDPNVSFEVADAGDLATLAGAFGDVDVVASFEMIEHLTDADRARFLGEAREILAPRDGFLVVSTPNGERPFAEPNPYHAEEFGPEELARQLTAAGFGEPRIEGVYVQPPWPRLEHFATTVPFRGVFRALARAGRSRPRGTRTLLALARA